MRVIHGYETWIGQNGASSGNKERAPEALYIFSVRSTQ